MDENVVVKQTRKGNFLYISAAVAMSLLYLFLLFSNIGTMLQNSLIQVLFWVIMAFGFLFFAGCSFFIIKRALSKKDILTVTADGITDNSSALAFGFIPWSDMERIYLDSVMKNTFIEIQLKNEEAYISRFRGIRKWMILANRRMGHQAVCITLNSSGVSPQKLLVKLQERLSASQRNAADQ